MSYRSGINSFSQIDLTGIQLDYILKWDGTKFVPSPDLVGGVADTHFASTDLTFSAFRAHDLGLYGMTLNTDVKPNAFYIDPSGNIGLGTNIANYPLTISATSAVKLPVGDTSQRPGSPVDGLFRYNNETFFAEFYGNGQWKGIGANMANTTLDITGSPIHRLGNNGSWSIGTSGSTPIFTVSDFLLPSIGIGNVPLPTYTLHIEATDAIKLPVGTTAQRPLLASIGLLRYNATSNVLEYRDNAAWRTLSTTATDVNFANTNLTFTGSRTHTLGSNDLILSTTGNGNTFVIDGDTGNIGLGISVPTSKFHVIGDDDLHATSTKIIKNASGNLLWDIRNDGRMYLGSYNGGPSVMNIIRHASFPTVTKIASFRDDVLSQEIDFSAASGRFIIAKSTASGRITWGNKTANDQIMALDVANDRLGILAPTPLYTLDVGGTGAIRLPVGTTAQRPAGNGGVFRYNSTDSIVEWHNGTNWIRPATADSNFANIDLTFTGPRLHDLAGNFLRLSNSASIEMLYDSLGGTFTIGGGSSNGQAVFRPTGGRMELESSIWHTIGSMRYRPGTYVIFDSGTGIHSPNNQPAMRVSENIGNATATILFTENFTSSTNINGRATAFYLDHPITRDVGTVDPTGVYINQIIGTTSNDNDLVAMDITPTYSYNATTNHNTIGIRFSATDHNADLVGLDIVHGEVRFQDTSALQLHSGTTAQRPTGNAGKLRWNSDLTSAEIHDGTSWVSLATGGSDTNFSTTDLTFTTDRTHTLAVNTLTIRTTGSSNLFVLNGNTNRLGLGVTSPQDRLDVDGNIRTSGSYRSNSTVHSLDNRGNGFLSYSADSVISQRLLTIGNLGYGKFIFNSEGAVKLPLGTTIQRPTGEAGLVRYNSDNNLVEFHNGTIWSNVGVDTNFATNDLTFTANRTHTLAGNNLTLSTTGDTNTLFVDATYGNIGIGTNSSANTEPKLSVSTTARINGLRVEATGGGASLTIDRDYNTMFSGGTGAMWLRYEGGDHNVRISTVRGFGGANSIRWYGNNVFMMGIFPDALGGSATSGRLLTGQEIGPNASQPVGILNALHALTNGVEKIFLYTGSDNNGSNEPSFDISIERIADRLGNIYFNTRNPDGTGNRFRNLSLMNTGVARFEGTAALRLHTGTTAQRPTGVQGMLRANSDGPNLEWYDGTGWQALSDAGSDIHFASTDLTLTGNRTHDLGSNTLNFFGTGHANILHINGANGRIGVNKTAGSSMFEVAGTVASVGSGVGSYLTSQGIVQFIGPSGGLGLNTIATSGVHSGRYQLYHGTDGLNLKSIAGFNPIDPIIKIGGDVLTISESSHTSRPNRVGINTSVPSVALDINSTDAIKLPVGNNTSDRPTGVAGMFRYNNTDSIIEWYNGATWVQPSTGVSDTNFGISDITFSGNRLHTLASNSLALSTTYSANAFRIDPTNGRIGVNISPAATLHIASDAPGVAGSLRIDNTNIGGSGYAGIAFNADSATTDQILLAGTNYSGLGVIEPLSMGFYASNSGGIAMLAADSNATIRFGIGSTGNHERLTINSTGIGILSPSPAYTLDIGGTDAIKIPVGTTGEQPTGVAGLFRYNSTLGQFEGHNGTAWASFSTGGADTNFTTTDLSLSANRDHHLGGNTLTFGRTGFGDATPSLFVDGSSTDYGVAIGAADLDDNNGTVQFKILYNSSRKAGAYITDNDAVNAGSVPLSVNRSLSQGSAVLIQSTNNNVNTQAGNATLDIITSSGASNSFGGIHITQQFVNGDKSSATAYGNLYNVYVQSTGTNTTLGSAYGFYSRHQLVESGGGDVSTITNFYDFAAVNGTFGTNSTITNRYGLYIAYGNSGGQITNAWGVYQADGAVDNFFGGRVGLGKTPSAAIEIDRTDYDQDLIIFDTAGTEDAMLKWNAGSTTQYKLGKNASGIFRIYESSVSGNEGLSYDEQNHDGFFGINQGFPAYVLHINSTDAIKLPVGTDAQRPGTPIAGLFRYNTDQTNIEFYNGSTWVQPGAGGSDTNITTGNLTFTAPRTHTINDNELVFQGTSSNDILKIDGDGAWVGIAGGSNSNVGLAVGGTEGVLLPVGTSAQRPSIPAAGMIRGNSVSQTVEVYTDSDWRPIEQTYEMVTTSTTSTITMYKNTVLLCDQLTGSTTITLNPDNLAEGSVVKIFNTDSNSFTLDSSTGNFTYNSSGTTTANAATRTIAAGATHTLVWWDTGSLWYFID